MANIIRSAKSGSDWTDNVLIAYNITISSVFPVPDPSLDHIDPTILNSPPGTLDPVISDLAAGYLGYLDLAVRATQETFIDDFAAETLKPLGFKASTRVAPLYLRVTFLSPSVAKPVVLLRRTCALPIAQLSSSLYSSWTRPGLTQRPRSSQTLSRPFNSTIASAESMP